MDTDTNDICSRETLVNTFVFHKGGLNFESPALHQLNFGNSGRDETSIMDCDQTETYTTPTKDRPWRRQHCWDRSDTSVSYSFTPDSVTQFSRFPEVDEMISSTMSEHASTVSFTAEFSFRDPPPPKRFKLNKSVNRECDTGRKDRHCWSVLRHDDIDDLGVAPIREEFFPRAASTPVSSPRTSSCTVPLSLYGYEDSDYIMNSSGVRHARRRLDFRNEDEEAVFYLINKYLTKDYNPDI